jgi:hypothetical protein
MRVAPRDDLLNNQYKTVRWVVAAVFKNSGRFTNEGGYLDHQPGDSDA